MAFDYDNFYGFILKGDLHGAIGYLKLFPEKRELCDRYLDIFEHERYITYDMDAELNEVLMAYQRYYRDVFYLRMDRERAETLLTERLAVMQGIADDRMELGDLERERLVKLFESRGFHFLGGKTSGYYGPYVWRTTETVSYEVELPDGVQTHTVKLLDGFLTRSWLDFLSFGQIGPGGWTDGDGIINCVKSAWNLESEGFRISLLKHEAQHAKDLEIDRYMSSGELEYRAKLVELIYSRERNLLKAFAWEADDSEEDNGHALAASRILHEFAQVLGVERLDPAALSTGEIQGIARMLFEKSGHRERK